MNKSPVWFWRALILALFLVVGLGFGRAAAYTESGDELENSLYYLYQNQNVDGGLKDKNLSNSQDLQTAWAALAFASAGYDPVSVKHTDSQSLMENIEEKACSFESVTDIERTILVVKASNLDPTNFGGCDLLAKITTDPETGQIGIDLMSTIFGVYVYSAADLPISEKTVAYILSNQKEDGGFDPLGWGEDSNTTAQALVALIDAGVDRESPSVQQARQFLKNLQIESGGIKYDSNFWTVGQDAFSDAYVLQAISVLGEDPKDEFWLAEDKSILDGLELLKQSDGSYFYSSDPNYGDSTPVWTTAIVILGLSGSGFPIYSDGLNNYSKADTILVINDDSDKKFDQISDTDAVVTESLDSQTNNNQVVLTGVPVRQPQVSHAKLDPATEQLIALDADIPQQSNLNPESSPEVLGEVVEPEKINYWYLIVIIIISLFFGIFLARINRRKSNEI